MKYIYTEQPIEQAAAVVSAALQRHLSDGHRILWLLSGGSSINVAVMAAQRLLNNHYLANLAVSLTDERYGQVGHINENWQQLMTAGFKLPGANLYRPLIGQSLSKTTTAFSSWLRQQLKAADYKIGIFGIGDDGHTAGIKPNSSAAKSTACAVSFKGDDFLRMTISFATIRQFDEAVIQVSGDSKEPIIHDLFNTKKSLISQPAQILKTIPKSTLFTNIREENI
jgi:6-phosphogluconolactonase/glucosamine-6-phosphate isomerase/deaminase